jgi:glycosyltransferase involved in cell wall biosynthesis
MELDLSNMNKILFLPTLTRSVMYYRMESFARQMVKAKDSSTALFYKYELPDEHNSWEMNIKHPEFFHELHEMVQRADIIVTQCVHTQDAIAFLCAVKEKYNIPVFAEFDDDPYSLSSQHPYFDRLAPGTECELWADDLVLNSDGLIVSTDYLKKRFQGKNKNINVVPNGIDFSIWDDLKEKKKKDIINIGWVGGGNHQEDLDIIERPIKHILKKYPNVRFTLAVGNEAPFYFLKNKQIKIFDFRHWKSIDKYPQFMKDLNIDIGIAPLRDRLHNRSKSNLKWLEYGALKVPMIGSPVEPYLQTNAILAKSEEDWINALELLIQDSNKRHKLGEEAYNLIKENFNVEKIAENYLNILRGIIAKKRAERNLVYA